MFASSRESNISAISMSNEPSVPVALLTAPAVKEQRKRVWEEEEDWGMDGDCEDNSIFSQSFGGLRVKAQPRNRRRPSSRRQGSREVVMSDVGDFGEATFLVPGD